MGASKEVFESALALQRAGESALALARVEELLAVRPAHARALALRSMLEPWTGDDEVGGARRALAFAERGYAARPDLPPCAGALCRALHRVYAATTERRSAASADAVDLLRRAARVAPGDPTVHFRLAQTARSLRLFDEARQHFQATLDIDPHHDCAAFWLSTIDGSRAVGAAPVAHVRALYDGYAATYDEHLSIHLESNTPQLCAAALRRALLVEGGCDQGRRRSAMSARSDDDAAWSCCDLGCGTGLSGAELRKALSLTTAMTTATTSSSPEGRQQQLLRLVGVDVSEAMCSRARGRRCDDRPCYDAVVCDEVCAALSATAALSYDALVSSDVLPYFGDLDAVFDAAHRVARPGAPFVFSLEDATRAATTDWELGATGRYRHTSAYVAAAAKKTGFALTAKSRETLRKNCGQPVYGHIYVLRRGSNAAPPDHPPSQQQQQHGRVA